MINGNKLLNDLKPVLRKLEADMRGRCDALEEIDNGLKTEYQDAVKAERTAETYTVWRDDLITQSAVAWILGCVFIRFMEDNGLVETIGISGIGERLEQARDNHTLYFREHPKESDREYLEQVFRGVSHLPAIKELFGIAHNPLWRLAPTGDGAAMLLAFFQKIDASTGRLIHDFTDENWGTRFLGDLYQELSESARKKYALLQTPDFVESFILDRTLTPAIDTFGLAEVRMIDPTCGSGHFILGGFHRLLTLWQQREPETNERELAARALDAVYGVDLNPYAVAIARFRLLVAALKASGIRRMKDAPDFKMHLAVGDSLLHGPRPGGYRTETTYFKGFDPIGYVYDTEDAEELGIILGQQYHVVVGNPPYITVKDKALSSAYRERFKSCYRKYSLIAPFFERFFDLAFSSNDSYSSGYIGLIAANSFMKREFGKKLVQEHIPKWDLTHVIDTSGVNIPGHGTPTVIIFARHQKPVADVLRTVMGIKSDISTSNKMGNSGVWNAILEQIDAPGTESDFISVADVKRSFYHKHPWCIKGGGATELKESIDSSSNKTLSEFTASIGFGAILGEDDAFAFSSFSHHLQTLDSTLTRPLVVGEMVRDWRLDHNIRVLFPYSDLIKLLPQERFVNLLWSLRTVLWARLDFSKKTYKECSRPYWEYHQIPVKRKIQPKSISFPFVCTHNNFVFGSWGENL